MTSRRCAPRIGAGKPESVQQAAEQFTTLFARDGSSTVVLGRVFLVVPLDRLPPGDSAFARALAVGDPPAGAATTPVLLTRSARMGGARQVERTRPLLWRTSRDPAAGSGERPGRADDRAPPQPISQVDLEGIGTGESISTRRMIGGRNAMFYVPDARTSARRPAAA